MDVFELILSLLIGGVLLALLAPRLGVPWPALLALAGAGLAFVPGVPQAALDPQLALALFVAPVLLDAAYDASPRDLRDNWVPVTGLVLVAVGLTVAAVAFLARALVPDMPWAAAVALGAIVAPPDAAAATAVLRQVRMPYRMLMILEGESLLNDASALLIYRVAVGAAISGVTVWTAPLLVLAVAGGITLGVGLARAYLALTARVRDAAASVVLQFLGVFGVWILADRLGLSAVLTMVAYAITIARLAPTRLGARRRRNSYAVWEVAVFVLNVLAFILVGLQLRGILERLDGRAASYAQVALAVLAAVILIRITWVMGYNTVVRWKNRRYGARTARPMLLPTVQGGVVLSWCGMRGIVTLAAALALPESFPFRDLIVFTAFCVVLGTLVLQGMTLRPLIARLRLPSDTTVEDETRLARLESARAALAALAPDRDSKAGHVLASEYKARIDPDTPHAAGAANLIALRRRSVLAERRCVAELLRSGRIGDTAFHLLEEELDWRQAALEGDGDDFPAPTPAS